MFTFIGARRSTCAKNNKLCICPKYKQFISRIKDYSANMYEIITGYFSIGNDKFLLCYAAEDDATDGAIENYQLFSSIEDRAGNMLPSQQTLDAIYKQLNINIDQDIMFSMLGAEQVSENIVRVPVMIVKNDYGGLYGKSWTTEVIQTNKNFDIVIPDNIVPFEWI